MLALFDIDGTLLVGSHRPHFAAMRTALASVFSITIDKEDGVEKAGRTDYAIARDVARVHGVPNDVFAAGRDDLGAAWVAALEMLEVDFSTMVPQGMSELLQELVSTGDRVTVVTGNLRAIAEHKLRSGGLETAIAVTQGAFGSDSEIRDDLPPLARLRAGGSQGAWDRATTVLVGDTPRDIACARSDKLRCIAVTTGGFSAEALEAAEWIAEDVPALARALSAAASRVIS